MIPDRTLINSKYTSTSIVTHILSPNNLLSGLLVILFFRNYFFNIFLVISYTTISLAIVLAIELLELKIVDFIYFLIFIFIFIYLLFFKLRVKLKVSIISHVTVCDGHKLQSYDHIV